jgi:hypothetical protein
MARVLLTMSILLVTSCEGLHTQPNNDGELPPGALSVGDNVTVARDGIIEVRRGFESVVSSGEGGDEILHLAPYAGTLIAQTASTVYQSNAAVSALTSVASETNAEVPRLGASSMGEWLYLTDGGVAVWEEGRTSNEPGVYAVQVPILTPLSGGSMQETNTQVAYRAVVVRKTATDPGTIISAPSGRAVISNSTGSKQDVAVSVVASLPTTGYTLQFYRSVQSEGATVDPGDELGLIYERTTFPAIFSYTTASGLTRVGSTVTVVAGGLQPKVHGLQAGDLVYHAGTTDFPPGHKVVTSVPSPTTFTYEEAGAATSGGAMVIVAGYGFVDNTTDAIIGASLYTNASQEGILQANTRPPMVLGDVAEFRRCAFYGYARERQAYDFRVLSVGAPDGIQGGDTVTVGGYPLTAGTSEGGSTFRVYTSGLIAENIANTAQSLARMIGVVTNGQQFAVYTPGATDVPGAITITAENPSVAAFTVAFSRPSSVITFAKSSSEATTFKNRVYYSKVDLPEAVPLLNYFDVGSADAPVLRLVPLRDALIVLKEDGIFRITGDGPWNFRVDPFDLTTKPVGAYTAATLENTVVVLTDQGVARISDTGVVILTRPIEDQILPLLTASMLDTVKAYAFGIGYDSARKYLLWMPTSSSDTSAQVAYVYDLFTEAWSKWTVPARHGVLNPADDRLYVAQGGAILRERKDFASTDLQDAAGATIPVAVEWAPKFGERPDVLHQFREVGLLVGSAEWTAAQIGFATDLDPTMEWVALPETTTNQLVRVGVPRTKQRGRRLRVQFQQNQAARATQIKGLRVVYETTGERVRR